MILVFNMEVYYDDTRIISKHHNHKIIEVYKDIWFKQV